MAQQTARSQTLLETWLVWPMIPHTNQSGTVTNIREFQTTFFFAVELWNIQTFSYDKID